MRKEPDLIAYAASLEITCENYLPFSIWARAGIYFFNALAWKCEENSDITVGHIKGFLQLEEFGYFYLSTVGYRQGTHIRGEGKGKAIKGRLDFNVLVYGAEKEAIDSMVDSAVISLGNQLKSKCLRREL